MIDIIFCTNLSKKDWLLGSALEVEHTNVFGTQLANLHTVSSTQSLYGFRTYSIHT